jgi:hypothetical protein
MTRLRTILLIVLVLWLVPLFSASAQTGSDALIGQEYVLESGQVLDHDLVLLGGTAHLKPDSAVQGDVALVGAEAVVEGRVEGGIVAFGGAVTLGATAEVMGDVVALGGLQRHPDARVHGNVVTAADRGQTAPAGPGQFSAQPDLGTLRFFPWGDLPRWGRQLVDLGRLMVGIFFLLLIAAVGASLLAENVNTIKRVMISSAPLAFGTGLLTLALVALLVPLLFIICIGAPVALALILALLVALLLAWVATGALVGHKVLEMLHLQHSSVLAQTLVGTLIITALANVPCVGALFACLVLSWALGAVVLSRFGTTLDPRWVAVWDNRRYAAVPGAAAAGAAAAAAPQGKPADPGAAAQRDTRRLGPNDLGSGPA